MTFEKPESRTLALLRERVWELGDAKALPSVIADFCGAYLGLISHADYRTICQSACTLAGGLARERNASKELAHSAVDLCARVSIMSDGDFTGVPPDDKSLGGLTMAASGVLQPMAFKGYFAEEISRSIDHLLNPPGDLRELAARTIDQDLDKKEIRRHDEAWVHITRLCLEDREAEARLEATAYLEMVMEEARGWKLAYRRTLIDPRYNGYAWYAAVVADWPRYEREGR